MKNQIYFIILLLGLLFTGCSKNSVTDPQTEMNEPGKVLLKFNKTETPVNVAVITATLTRQGFATISGTLNILTDTSAELLMQSIVAGAWHLKVEAKDVSGTVLYKGETDVNIIAGTITQVSLSLQPTTSTVGGIYITVTWGSQYTSDKWTAQQSGTAEHLQTIYFINPNTGWAAGANGVILKTTNGGASWIKQASGTTKRVNSLCFLNENLGWAVGDNGLILKTVNGGAYWDDRSTIIPSSLYSLHFYYGGIGWITGANGTIIKIDNSKDSLYLKNFTSGLLLNSFFINENTGWIVGGSGIILKTTNGGQSWFDSGSSGGWQWLQSVYFSNSNSGIAVGGSGSIIRTINGGQSWFSISSGTSEHLEELSFINTSTGWAVGDHGTVMKTTNSGESWSFEKTSTSSWLNAVYFYDQNNGWTVGNNGTILKYKP